MNVLMVTPHLPPYQAANAILPDLLGRGLRARGHAVDVSPSTTAWSGRASRR